MTGRTDHKSYGTSLVARQPILDLAGQTFGFELLFRSTVNSDVANVWGGDMASFTVIGSGMSDLGLDRLTAGKRAFINCTREIIVGDFARLLPKDLVVLEILEDTEIDDAFIEACYALASDGYMLALDDFEDMEKFEPLLSVVKIVKIDFLLTKGEDRKTLVDLLAPMGVTLLAEKIEDELEFEDAKRLGFTLFQGFFFAKPTIVSTPRPPSIKGIQLQLMELFHETPADLVKAENLLKRDPGLTHRLMRYINSAHFGLGHSVASPRQAFALLGDANVRRWLLVLTMLGFDSNKPPVLYSLAVQRGRLCELLAPFMNLKDEGSELFLTGMFSLFDAITGRHMEHVVQSMPLTREVAAALIGFESSYSKPLEVARKLERGQWDQALSLVEPYGITEESLSLMVADAMDWGSSLLGVVSETTGRKVLT